MPKIAIAIIVYRDQSFPVSESNQEKETTLMEHEKFNIITYCNGIGVMRCCLVKKIEC